MVRIVGKMIRQWIEEDGAHAEIEYIEPPKMRGSDLVLGTNRLTSTGNRLHGE